ncbi:GNAT family N-acetyltransferase [Streptomyces sp. NPDC090306]|uniref:GNAT family N-acetyltransferase n=1 Tax=Streptomyces sp. NPDC090306 TaxID=3365961 RepID=UPI003823DFF1
MHAGPIGTRRLRLVPLGVAHAGEMAEVLADPALHEFVGGRPLSPDALRARYERLVAGSPDPAESWCNWVVRARDTGGLVGTVQATVRNAGTGPAGAVVREAEVAWVVGTRRQGQGIASEAAVALVGWLRARGVATVVAHVHPDHRASGAVAAAAGLAPTARWQDGEVRWEWRSGAPGDEGPAGHDSPDGFRAPGTKSEG